MTEKTLCGVNNNLTLPVSELHILLPGPFWILDWLLVSHLFPIQTPSLHFPIRYGSRRVGHFERSPHQWLTTAGYWYQLACFPGQGKPRRWIIICISRSVIIPKLNLNLIKIKIKWKIHIWKRIYRSVINIPAE